MPRLFLVLNLRIRYRGIAHRTPVDHPGTLVNITFLVHFAENFRDSLIAALIHRETLSVPVAGGTKLLELADDPPAVLLFPVPRTLKELLTPKVMLIDPLLLQFLDDLDLRGNACMVRSRLPERIVPLHSLKTDQNVLHRIVQCMSHMQLPCNIWRRDHDRKRFSAPVCLRMKIFLIQPFLIDPVLQTVRIIGLCQFFSHTVLCSFLQMKKTFTVSSTAKGEQTRYHLCLSACDIHTRHLNRL